MTEAELSRLEVSAAQLAELERNPGPRKKPKLRPTRDDQARDELGRWAKPKRRK